MFMLLQVLVAASNAGTASAQLTWAHATLFDHMNLLVLLQVPVGAPFYKQAWHGLKYGSANMGLLVAL
jgi:cation transport ATPase